MRHWYDTEFIDRGERIQPISIGIVAKDGRTFYEVCDWFDYEEACTDEWLKTNVIDKLEKPRSEWLSRQQMQWKIQAFFKESWEVSPTPNEVWAWFAAHDHVILCQLFGGFMKIPPYVPQYTMDVRQEMRRLGDPKIVRPRNINEHNALSDAWECKQIYEALRDWETSNPHARRSL